MAISQASVERVSKSIYGLDIEYYLSYHKAKCVFAIGETKLLTTIIYGHFNKHRVKRNSPIQKGEKGVFAIGETNQMVYRTYGHFNKPR